MSSQQETMSARSVDEEALEEAFEEIERVRDDLRRKQSHYGTAGFRPGQTINPNGGDTTLGLSHDTKVRLAMSASTASMPGAFSNDEVSPRGSNLKPSQAQLEEISGLRERQKRRQQSNGESEQADSTEVPIDDLGPITDLQERMSAFKNTTHDEIAQEKETLATQKKRFYIKVGLISAISIVAISHCWIDSRSCFCIRGWHANGGDFN